MQKITPCLWYDNQTEAAIARLTAAFADSRVISLKRYPDGPLDGPMAGREGLVLFTEFELAGERFMALDGGPYFKFTPAVSFFVNCATEAELDALWAQCAEGGAALMPLGEYPFSPKFGWVQDRDGLSWQLNLAARDQKITPFLMFVGEQHGKAEEAIGFYTGLFADSGLTHLEKYGEGEPGGAPGTVKQALFRLAGQEFRAIDSNFAHEFGFSEAISFYVTCETQGEVDHLWTALSAVPQAEQCGWLKDRFGISWQIIPTTLTRLMNDPDSAKAARVTEAMLGMKKIDIAALERAHAG